MPNSNDFFKGKRILVGDYIKISADYTTKNLNKLGIIVDVVQKGEDIVKIIKSGEKKYDAIFTNHLYKEGYDGVTTLQNLRKIKGFNIPVVIHTVDFDSRHEYVDEIGFDEYIEKPVDTEKVIPVLNKIWKRH